MVGFKGSIVLAGLPTTILMTDDRKTYHAFRVPFNQGRLTNTLRVDLQEIWQINNIPQD